MHGVVLGGAGCAVTEKSFGELVWFCLALMSGGLFFGISGQDKETYDEKNGFLKPKTLFLRLLFFT